MVCVCCQEEGPFFSTLSNWQILLPLLTVVAWSWEVCVLYQQDRKTACLCTAVCVGEQAGNVELYNKMGNLMCWSQTRPAEPVFQEMLHLCWMETSSKNKQEAAGGLCCHGTRSQRGLAASPQAGWASTPQSACLLQQWWCAQHLGMVLWSVVRCCHVEHASALGLVNGQLLVVGYLQVNKACLHLGYFSVWFLYNCNSPLSTSRWIFTVSVCLPVQKRSKYWGEGRFFFVSSGRRILFVFISPFVHVCVKTPIPCL